MAPDSLATPNLVATQPTLSLLGALSAPPARGWEGAGTVVGGRYTLLQCVGQGGMGAVWSAQQTAPVRRLVAVKLLHGRGDSRNVLARFEAERQALAVMDHPNVAKILDGGVSDAGSPYFVMEYVKGVPITRFCDERQLTPARRLELFVPVCEAIQHAHQKGIIHRDIKPSNVLVALANDRPVPKVIDFGVAKATGAALTDLTLNTEFGVVVGTPQYMSPEQAGLTGSDIDTRSDVYSLGVLLYELLTGGPPFRQRGAERDGLLEVLRLIREEEPTRPSARLTQAAADALLPLALLSERRGTDPARLVGLLRGELDWVVMKALEKDRTRRYETPAALAADVRRYLGGEAVLAHPPSLRYRAGKALRRNRVPAVAAAAVALALVAGMVGTTAGLLRAEAARAAEAEQRGDAEAARAAEAELRELADARRAQAVAAEALAEKRAHAAAAAQERTMNVLRAATGEDVEKLIGSRKDLGPNERAYLEAIAGRWQELARTTGGTPEARFIAAEGASRVAHLRMMLGEDDAAVAGFRAVAAGLEKLLAEAPADVGYRRELAQTRGNLGKLLYEQGRATEGEAEERRGLELRAALVADFPGHAGHRDNLASSRLNLGILLARGRRYAEAEAEIRAARALYVVALADPAAAAEGRAGLAKSHNTLGVILAETGRPAEAEAEYRLSVESRRKLAAEFPHVPDYPYDYAGTRQNLGNLLLATGRVPDAEREFRGALATTEKLVADFPGTPRYRVSLGGSYCNFANLLLETGRPALATPYADKAVAALTAVLAKNPNDGTGRLFLRSAYLCRAKANAATGRHDEADADFDRVIAYSPPGDHPEVRRMKAASRPKPEVAPPPRDAK